MMFPAKSVATACGLAGFGTIVKFTNSTPGCGFSPPGVVTVNVGYKFVGNPTGVNTWSPSVNVDPSANCTCACMWYGVPAIIPITNMLVAPPPAGEGRVHVFNA